MHEHEINKQTKDQVHIMLEAKIHKINILPRSFLHTQKNAIAILYIALKTLTIKGLALIIGPMTGITGN